MGKITAIEPQKRNTDRVSLFVDTEFFLGISLYICEKNKLKVGMEIDEDIIQKIAEQEDVEKGKNYAVNYCLDKTEHLVRKKLTDKGYSPTVIDEIIAFLFKYNLIDDQKYARAYAHDAVLLKKRGKRRISQELRSKGVSAQLIELVLSELEDDDQTTAAISRLKSKIPEYKRKSKNNYEFKNKCYTFLARNGFQSETINLAINHYLQED